MKTNATPADYADLSHAYQASLQGRTVLPAAVKNFLEELARLRGQSAVQLAPPQVAQPELAPPQVAEDGEGPVA